MSNRLGFTRRDTDQGPLSTDAKASKHDSDDDAATTVTTDLDSDSEREQRLRNALVSGAGAANVLGPRTEGEQDKSGDGSLEKYATTRWELWAFYIYYIGNSGLPTFNFAPIAFQNLLTLAAQEFAASASCNADDTSGCRLPFSGSDKTINSIVLICNGISFAIQAAIFLSVGSMADFGRGRPWILIVATVITIAVGFGWLGVTDPAKWRVGAGLYIVGLVGYQVCLTFWTSAFVGLARNLPIMRDSLQKLTSDPPSTTPEEHQKLDVLIRNRISNVAFFVCSVGELVVLAIMQGILEGIHANRDTETNTRALTYVIAFGSAIWVVTALPWFVMEKHRPGLPIPEGMNIFTAGARNAWQGARHIWTLKQSLLYLIFYFIMSDALNTSVTQISIIQAQLVSFSTTKSNLLLIVGIAAQAVGIGSFWLIQKRLKLNTFTMLKWVCLFIVLLQVWGFIGIFTQEFGFHKEYEAYLYQTLYGLFICPWYAVSQTAISEVTPSGLEFQFFTLFSLLGKTSAFVGPFVSSAIANDTGNESTPFYFLLACAVVACFLLIPMDSVKARVEQAAFLEKRKLSKI
ncbi:unnamed protein product [Sympodiomycopsis kandeliae]